MEIAYLPSTDVSCWLPFASSPFFIEDYYGNHILYPLVIPQTKEYMQLDQAILRARLRKTLAEQATNQQAKDIATVFDDLVTVSEQGITLHPALMHYLTDPREAVHIALDGLEPSSTPIYRRDATEEGYLCFAVCLEGETAKDDTQQESIKINFASGLNVELGIEPDRVLWCMATPGEEAVVEYNLKHHTLDGKKQGSIGVTFGEVGLVIDGRGRPFDVPQDNPQGKERIANWLGAMHSIRLLT